MNSNKGTRQHTNIDAHIWIIGSAAKGLLQILLNAATQDRIIAVARNVNQAGCKTAKRIIAHIEGNTGALLQLHDTEADTEKFVFADLEQLILRIIIKDMHQRLAVM